jgi:hypothetical protein
MLGDVAQPMHTHQRDAEEAIHSSYESPVDSRCMASVCRYHARNDGWDGGRLMRGRCDSRGTRMSITLPSSVAIGGGYTERGLTRSHDAN